MKLSTKKITAILIAGALTFSGCAYQQEESIIINDNETITYNSVMSVEREEAIQAYTLIMEAMRGDSGEELIEEETEETETETSYEDALDEALTSQGFEIVEYDGIEYYEKSDNGIYTFEEYYENVDSSTAVYISTDTFYYAPNVFIATVEDDTEDIGDIDDSGVIPEELSGLIGDTTVSINISVEFPREIVASNGQIDEEYKQLVVFDQITEKDTDIELFATTNSEMTIEQARMFAGVPEETTTQEVITQETVTQETATQETATQEVTTQATTKVAETTAQATTKAPETKKEVKLGKVKIKSAKRDGKKIKLSFKKVTGADSYNIKYSTSSKFKAKATKKTNTKKTTLKLKNIKTTKTYYIKVQAVKGNKTGKWSKVKVVKAKKK